MRKVILLSICFVAFCVLSHAQVIVKGNISDASNNEPIVGGFISIKSLNLYSITDEAGTYQLILPAPTGPKDLVINVSSLGYVEVNEIIELQPVDDGSSIVKSFLLEVDPLTLKDVIVTANKVEEELQDVPIAVSVLDAQNLESRTVSSAEEAFEVIPNFTFDGQNPGRPSISLRGLTTLPGNAGVENSVGLYIDEVFQSRSYNFNSTLMDIERVEVLRGPQGTLFGKNTVGGLLHIITEKPKYGNFGAVELSAGNFNFLQIRGKANTELIKNKLALRVTGAYKKRDGWLQEENPEVQSNNGTTFYGGRIGLRYDPNDRISWIVRATYSRDDRADFNIDYLTPANGFDRIPVPEAELDPFDRKVKSNESEYIFEREEANVSSHLSVKLGNVHTLTSITSYTDFNNYFARDFDATSVDAVYFGRGADVSSFSQDLRIATPRENRKLFYIGGLFFLNDEVINTDTLALKGAMANVWKSIPNFANLPINEENYLETVNINSSISSSSIAGYFSGSYEISDRIRFNGGFRYTVEKKEMRFVQTPMSPFVFPGLPNGIAGLLVASPIDTEREVTDKVWSGNFGMDFKTADNILIYLNYSRGFKGSGFNITFTPSANPEDAAFRFKPEFTNSYEVGVKLKSSNRFLLNSAVFVTDFRNKQELVAAGTSIFVSNAKNIQGQGLETEFIGVWNKFLKTSASLGLINLKYLDFPFINPSTGEEINLSGNRAIKAPSSTFKFSPQIHFPLGQELKVLIRADYNYIGKAYNDIFNTEHLSRQGASRVNARLSFSTKNDRYSISLWGKNLTDEVYFQHAWSFVFGDHASINQGRTLGIELRANFYK